MFQQNYFVAVSIVLLVLIGGRCLAAKPAEEPNKTGDGKRILIFSAFSSYSMRISMWPLIQGLADKGHHVTYLSGHDPKVPDPRVEDFVPPKIKEATQVTLEDFDFIEERRTGQNIKFWYDIPIVFGVDYCEHFYEDPVALDWMRKSKFDLVVVDSLNECGFGLGHYFNAKPVVYSTFNGIPWSIDAWGTPDESSWQADAMYYYPAFEPTFFSRIVAAVNPIIFMFIREHSVLPKLDKITRKAFEKLGVTNVPTFREMEKNTSLVFITTHYAQEYAKSFPPNVIPVGGLALTGKVKPIPKEFEDFINKGKNGFVYISFGSVTDISQLPQEQKDMMINALLQFPDVQFIWKAAGGVGVELPENFMVSKWVPQQDLLAHPKIRAFITHGGLGSTNEATYHGVPMLGFPFTGDQDYNTNFLEPRKRGLSLDIAYLTTDEFKKVLDRILTDPEFARNSKKVSKLFKDRPMSPVDTCVWWIEFALRHDTQELNEYMQSRSIHQSWWVRRQIDVWVFLAFVAALVVIIPSYLLYKLLRIIVGGGGGAQQKKKLKLK